MITSTTNGRVKLLRSLAGHRGRTSNGLFLAEGVRLAEEVIDAGVRPEVVLYDEEALRQTERGNLLLTDLEAAGAWLEPATAPVLASVSEVQHSQGIVLAVPLERPPAPERRRRPGALHDVMLVLDGLADPGNAGAVLRTARAAGVRQVRVTPGSVDLFGPKVVRAATGAHFWLTIALGFRWREEGARRAAERVVLAEAHAEQPYWAFDWTQPAMLVVGSEAHGASQAARQAATDRLRIPMPGGGDSLNAAMAAGILLFEAVRRRAAKGGAD